MQKIQPFERMEKFLYEKMKHRICSKQVTQDLHALHIASKSEELQEKYYRKKIRLFLTIVLVGNVFLVLSMLNSQSKGIIKNGEYIQKNSYGAGNIQAEAVVSTQDAQFEKQISLEVEEQAYTDEQLEQLYEEALPKLLKIVLQDNPSFKEVSQNLKFPEKIEGYPFYLKWESSAYSLINMDGEVKGAIERPEEKVEITILFSYLDWQKNYSLEVQVCRQELTATQLWEKNLQETIEESKQKSRYEEQWKLPQSIGGKPVVWKEKKENYYLLAALLIWVTAFAVYTLKDKDLQKELEKKNKELEEKYPAIVNKLTLYLEAGMSIRSSWLKIVEDYCRRKEQKGEFSYIYEEMLFTVRQMKGGMSETLAYEKFGVRCHLQQYIKLSTLLTQNLKKGNSRLLMVLREETISAQQERKTFAQQKGEEAGTKLLVPMMLMLLVVMILIMVPAFLSFSGT